MSQILLENQELAEEIEDALQFYQINNKDLLLNLIQIFIKNNK
jgi:hypothetical protein